MLDKLQENKGVTAMIKPSADWVWPLIVGNVITAVSTYTAIRSDLATVIERTVQHERALQSQDTRIRDLERIIPRFPPQIEKQVDKHRTI